VGLGRVGAAGDHLGGGLAVGGPVHLVLHDGEELLRSVGARVIIHAGGVDVEHLPPEDALRGTNIADAGEQFVEVAAATGLLQALVVHGEALDEVLFKPGRGPLAELGATRRVNAVADGEDHLQAVEFDVAGD
jgi:hypothetical protein